MSQLDEHQAVLAAARALMQPLARLLVAHGVPFAQAEESLKKAMVEAAREAHPDALQHRLVSRISTTTGINRREVTRLTRQDDEPAEPQRSAAANTFMRWRSHPDYLDARGEPLVLPRQGDAPSFESLARGVTQDVHPRSLLDELLRLGLARHEADTDRVALVLEAFVPSTDRVRMLEFLQHNVGDHLCAAVANVVGPAPRHLERAIFAHGLSHESVAAAQAWIGESWREIAATLVPFLEKLVADDAPRPEGEREQRFRAGLYAYTAREEDAPPQPPAAPVAGAAASAPVASPPAAPARRAGAAASPAAPVRKPRRPPSE